MPETVEVTFKYALGELVTLRNMHNLNPRACQALSIVVRRLAQGPDAQEIHYMVRPVQPPKGWITDGVVMSTTFDTGHTLPEAELMPFPEESRAAYRSLFERKADAE
jgi:hypothetical protein